MALDYEKFIRSDYNTTINNVSASAVSLLFKRINPNNSNILEDVEIQDSNYSNTSYLDSRYKGVKSTSEKYNFYTDGDKSYGKNAAIDINTTKFAWSNNINTVNLNFCDKTTINIKYLIDVTGSLTELSTKNDNLFEVQSMYKHGDNLYVSLFDKISPTNQSNLEGDKIIYEGGYSYSPLLYREINETLYFLYNEPKETTDNKLGVKTINKSSYIFKTIGNQDTDFATIPTLNTIFTIDGTPQSVAYSLSKNLSSNWPYTAIPLNTNGPYKRYNGTTFYDRDPKIELNSNYYTLDWFTPNSSASADGGYLTPDSVNSMRTNITGGERYQYYVAPRYSKYSININIPIKIGYNYNSGGGWSTFKVVGIIEYQKYGETTWSFVANTNLKTKTLPSINAIGVNEENSSIFVDDYMLLGSPYIQVSCILNDFRYTMSENDKIRLKVYFAEMRNFFMRTDAIYFEIQSGNTSTSFFEVWDTINSGTSLITTGSLSGNSDIFYLDSDNQTIVFNSTSSLLYKNVAFIEPTGSNSIAKYYSPIEDVFEFHIGDIVRFSPYNTNNADLYGIVEISEPVLSNYDTNLVVLQPLKVKLDRLVNYNNVNSRTFAFLRRKQDETSVIINYKKKEGATSSALVIPYNLDKNIKKEISNIVSPLKDKILSKILVV